MCSGRFCQALGSWRNSRALTTGTGGRLVVRVARRWAVDPVGLRHQGARPHHALCASLQSSCWPAVYTYGL